MSGFELDGTRYDWGDFSQILVRDQIKVERWLSRDGRDFTDARTWDDLINIANEINGLGSIDEQQQHPEFKFSLAVGIWLAKVNAGENVTLGDCLGRWTWDQLDFWADEEPEGKADAAP